MHMYQTAKLNMLEYFRAELSQFTLVMISNI